MAIRWSRYLSTLLLLLSCAASGTVRASRPVLMVGLGDSISAAALADTSTQEFWPFPWGLPIPSLDNPLDGIGFNSDFENKRTYSWVSGLLIQSHYRRLGEMLKKNGENLWALNFALTGAVSARVLDELKEAQVVMRLGYFDSLPYVTLLVGSNDLCKSVPLDQFKSNVHRIFEELSKIDVPDHQPIHVLVSSIPMIPELGEARVLDYKTRTGYSCRTARTLNISYCRKMTTWTNGSERQALVDQVNAVNLILKEATQDAAERHPNLLTYFSSTLSEAKVDVTHLAADCFHPNARGQEEIAQALWKDQPWFH
jgi:lysophospholipase L1-like esterase